MRVTLVFMNVILFYPCSSQMKQHGCLVWTNNYILQCKFLNNGEWPTRKIFQYSKLLIKDSVTYKIQYDFPSLSIFFTENSTGLHVLPYWLLASNTCLSSPLFKCSLHHLPYPRQFLFISVSLFIFLNQEVKNFCPILRSEG